VRGSNLAASSFASGEAALAGLWGAGFAGPRRLEDGRLLRVIFPGVPGGGSGPDYRDAILDAGGDLLRGDVELHLRASGWRQHGHHRDPAYAGVVLHVVAENDTGAAATLHASGRAIAVLVARGRLSPPAMGNVFRPPCALASARGRDPLPALERLGGRRLRLKAARIAPLVERVGAGQALYALLLETLGGPANRGPFAAIAGRLPLAALLERVESAAYRPLAIAAELKAAAAPLALCSVGLRPMAAPARRLETAGSLIAALWERGAGPGWPRALPPASSWRSLAVPGIGRGTAIEICANAVLPVALATGSWLEEEVEAAWAALPSPGTYGRLRGLEGWLTASSERPFTSAARLQGGLLLHADYCSRGMCGRCPLSPEPL
jgi:hypothetical protein